jgi:hypothetical protein
MGVQYGRYPFSFSFQTLSAITETQRGKAVPCRLLATTTMTALLVHLLSGSTMNEEAVPLLFAYSPTTMVLSLFQ